MLKITSSFYQFLKINSIIYHWFVNLIFWILNLFTPRTCVDLPENELLLISAVDAAALIRRGELSSFELVKVYINRITNVNPYINAAIADNFVPALEKAKEVDRYLDELDKESEEYSNLSKTKPLLGVPFSVKGNVFVKGFVCTAGVPARKDIPPCKEDSETVKHLKNSGAILLCITNIPEMAIWWETSNSIFGKTSNPYDLRRTSGGSSGGEAALISSCGSLFGLGNDVGGSLRVPAAFCGIFGLKPGVGVVPSNGLFPPIHGGYLVQMSTAGPMCRYAKDLPILLSVLAADEAVIEKLQLDKPVNLSKTRIFYMEELRTLCCESLHSSVRQSIHKAAKYFEKKYDISTHRLDLVLAHHAFEMFVLSFDRADHPKLSVAMTNFEYDVNTGIELVKWMFGCSPHTLNLIFTAFFANLPPLPKKEIAFVESKRMQLRREIVDLLGDDGILIFPAFATAPSFHNQGLFSPFNFIYNGIWNALGLPVLTCPLGLNPVDGMPTSVQIIASPNCERLLLAAAQDLEDGFGGWTSPTAAQFYNRFH